MTINNRLSIRLFLLLSLLLLPVLACSTLTGDGGDEEAAVELVEPAQSALDDLQDSGGETETVEEEVPASEAEVEEEVAEPQEEVAEPAESEAAESEGEGAGSAEPDQASGDVQEQIAGALRSATKVDAMRMHMVTEDLANDLVTEVTLAFIRPDRYQMSSEGVDLIIIEDTTYMSTGDGNWLTMAGTEMLSTVELTLEAFAGAEAIEERQSLLAQSEVNYEGKETINGVVTLVYSFNEGVDVAGFGNSVRMWIGEDDGLLYRQEIENTIAGAESRILMEFEYGDAVTIEPPL